MTAIPGLANEQIDCQTLSFLPFYFDASSPRAPETMIHYPIVKQYFVIL